MRRGGGLFNYGVAAARAAWAEGNLFVSLGARGCHGWGMVSPHFLRIEREGRDGSRHYVIHTHDPKFSMELMPDASAPDKIGKGVMKRICVPNSWAGDYSRYAKFMSAAQEFFEKSRAEPVSKKETFSAETRRWQA